MVLSKETQKSLPFDEAKTTQAAALFLALAGDRLNYMKLIKLLYMLDRASFERWGRSVSNDRYFSMKLGPVLSEVHDLITEPTAPWEAKGFWATHISQPSNFEVSLEKNPGTGKLSEAEEELIAEIYAKFGDYKPFDLVKLLHDQLPEWTEVTSGQVPLPFTDILKAINKSKEDIEEIEEEMASISIARSLFSA